MGLTAEPPQGWLALAAVADLLGLTQPSVRRLISSGSLVAFRLAPKTTIRVRSADLVEFAAGPTVCGCAIGSGAPVAPARPAIPAAVRRAVIARDGLVCAACRRTVSPRGRNAKRRLTLDHVLPFSKGGEDTEENLRVLCQSCNSRRGNRDDSFAQDRSITGG